MVCAWALNLLGEYIDFLGGSCLPMPLPYRTYVAGALRRDGVLRAASLQMPGDERTVVIRDIQPGHLRAGSLMWRVLRGR